MILAVCGPKPPQAGGYKDNPIKDAIVSALKEKLLELKPERVITGMDLGVGQWVADICINESISFEAVIPFKNYHIRWPPLAQQMYLYYLSEAIEVFNSGGNEEYKPELFSARTAFIMNRAQKLLYVNGNSSSFNIAIPYLNAARNLNKEAIPLVLPESIWSSNTEDIKIYNRPIKATSKRIKPKIEHVIQEDKFDFSQKRKLDLGNDD